VRLEFYLWPKARVQFNVAATAQENGFVQLLDKSSSRVVAVDLEVLLMWVDVMKNECVEAGRVGAPDTRPSLVGDCKDFVVFPFLSRSRDHSFADLWVRVVVDRRDVDA
jgi:hypothetical protein